MKSILAVLILVLAFNVFANEEYNSIQVSQTYSLGTTLGPLTSSGLFDDLKIAAQVQDYAQTGELSLELQALVQNIQAQDETVSLAEAIDIIQEYLVKIK